MPLSPPIMPTMLPFPVSLPRAVLLASAAIVLSSSAAVAQREVKSLSTLGATVGSTQRGTYYELTYGRFLKDKLRFEAALLAETGPRNRRGNSRDVADYRGYEIGLGLSPRLARFGEVVFLRVPLQVRARYERTPPSGGSPDQDGFAVGPSAGLAADVYLSDRIALSGEARTAWLFGHAPRKFPRYFGGGVSFYLGM